MDLREGAADLDRLLHFVRLYNSRSFHIWPLKRRGSESSHHVRLRDFGNNAWSVLRNLQDRRNIDHRYDRIMAYMADAFPAFDGIVLEQTGPMSVYASFLEKGRRRPIEDYAAGSLYMSGTVAPQGAEALAESDG